MTTSTPTTPNPYEQATPRPPRTASHAAAVRLRNRRRAYLARHPSYLTSADHELADPLLYDSLVRRFQTPAEREADGRARGYGRVLETSLLRGEAKLQRLAESYVDGPAPPPGLVGGNGGGAAAEAPTNGAAAGTENGGGRETNFTITQDLDPDPKDAEAGREQWFEFLQDRFVSGGDDEFDYSKVDENEEYDDIERQDAEDAWFDNEVPQWHDDDDDANGPAAGRTRPRELKGETGIQDF
ncbi:uncharacterized protein PpBr36_09305 [Pyricularia pennisetigena]|uniref:uncharacterized protein n=1 Tax=Pyricularia pennisetigena TaxID=1578925 RepID=UPI00114D6F48|nr:uncharacterized protein PpBr36_09305 [Pyricularia pennisetigena]TLS21804.1 hypothetical protein PpBr36_09305 [Pyricularia pennisetigena]